MVGGGHLYGPTHQCQCDFGRGGEREVSRNARHPATTCLPKCPQTAGQHRLNFPPFAKNSAPVTIPKRLHFKPGVDMAQSCSRFMTDVFGTARLQNGAAIDAWHHMQWISACGPGFNTLAGDRQHQPTALILKAGTPLNAAQYVAQLTKITLKFGPANRLETH